MKKTTLLSTITASAAFLASVTAAHAHDCAATPNYIGFPTPNIYAGCIISEHGSDEYNVAMSLEDCLSYCNNHGPHYGNSGGTHGDGDDIID